MRWRNDDMLLRIAQGDAYAMGYEYVKKKDAPGLLDEMLKLERFHRHPRFHTLAPGSYTDDTQQSLAIAQVIVARRNKASSHDFTDAFFECFKRDPRDSYSRPYQAILEEARSANHMRLLTSPLSDKNGAAMRAVPIGALPHVEDVIETSIVQAQSTHNSWGGVNSAIIVALMSHFALYDRRRLVDVLGYCGQFNEAVKLFDGPWKGPVGLSRSDKKGLGVGMCTAWAVSTLLIEETSLTDIMKRLLVWGGDTDSVAAIAWGIASARYRDEKLPKFLEDDLERGSLYGVDYLKTMGQALMESCVKA